MWEINRLLNKYKKYKIIGELYLNIGEKYMFLESLLPIAAYNRKTSNLFFKAYKKKKENYL